VAEFRKNADRVSKISIIPRGVAALGYTQQQPTEDRYLMTRAELLDRLDVLLGGRVAEEIVYGDVSTGAQDDLQRATDLIRHMVTRYGMTEALGLATFEGPEQANFLGMPSTAPREYSEDTARLIDTEIRKLFEAAHLRVRETLTEQRDALESLARLLMEREVVNRDTLTELLSGASAGNGRTDRGRTAAAKDPVCGMIVDQDDAVATLEHQGTTFYFCTADCREAFVSHPDDYLVPIRD
jgi:cell division protease FtsH